MNLPTRINPNPARNMNGCISLPVATPTFVIEKKIASIIIARFSSIKTEYLNTENGNTNLELDMIDNLEVLMDIEEVFRIEPGKIEDEEFWACKTFNQMVQCVRKYIV